MRFLLTALACVIGCAGPPQPHGFDTYAPIEARLTATAAQQRTILTRLASSDPLEVVWGAYLAGELGVAGASDMLIDRMADARVRDNVQDALARLGTHVPDSVLGKETSAMAIAMQNPGEHRDRIFAGWQTANESSSDWGGYANALAFIQDHSFAKALLERLTATVVITVVSPDTMQLIGGCSCSSSSFCSAGYATTAYTPLPPEPFWQISDIEADCLAILSGPADVCLTRSESAREETLYDVALNTTTPMRQAIAAAGHADALDDLFTSSDLGWPDDERDNEDVSYDGDHNARLIDYIALLSGRDVDFASEVSLQHVYRDDATYLAAAHDARDGVQSSYATLVNRLDEAHLLDEAPANIAVSFSIWDGRADDEQSPLPEL